MSINILWFELVCEVFLERQAHIKVCGEADSVTNALELAELHKPDIVVTELCLPDGYITNAMIRLGLIARMVAYSKFELSCLAEAYLEAGGPALLSYGFSLEELTAAVEAVTENRQDIPSINHFTASSIRPHNDLLSRREREIVALVTKGMTSKQIAARLYLSERTVKNHRHRIHTKLGIKNSAQLVDYAVRNGVVPKILP